VAQCDRHTHANEMGQCDFYPNQYASPIEDPHGHARAQPHANEYQSPNEYADFDASAYQNTDSNVDRTALSTTQYAFNPLSVDSGACCVRFSQGCYNINPCPILSYL